MGVHKLKQDSASSAYKNLTFCSLFWKTELCVVSCTADWQNVEGLNVFWWMCGDVVDEWPPG